MQPDGQPPSTIPSFPWRISWLHGLGTGSVSDMFIPFVHDVDLVVYSNNAAIIIFDSRTAINQPNPLLPNYQPNASYSATAFGPSMTVYEWVNSNAVCRLVAYQNWSEDEYAYSYSNDILPTSAWLDPRTTEITPRCLRSVSVLSHKTQANDIAFADGYNTNLTATTTSDSPVPATQVTLEAVPGDGLGTYYNDCTKTPVTNPSRSTTSPRTVLATSLSPGRAVSVFSRRPRYFQLVPPIACATTIELDPFAPEPRYP